MAEPGPSLKARPHVDYLLSHFTIVVDVSLECGEDRVPQLESADEVLEGVAEGAVPDPDILVESDLFLVNAELLCHQLEVEVYAPVLPVPLPVGDAVLAHHHERRVVLAAHPNVRYVVEPHAHLGDDQWVRRELEDDLARLNPLEVDDRSHCEVEIWPPPADYGVTLHA